MAIIGKGVFTLMSIMIIIPALILGFLIIAILLPESRVYFRKGMALVVSQIREIIAHMQGYAP